MEKERLVPKVVMTFVRNEMIACQQWEISVSHNVKMVNEVMIDDDCWSFDWARFLCSIVEMKHWVVRREFLMIVQRMKSIVQPHRMNAEIIEIECFFHSMKSYLDFEYPLLMIAVLWNFVDRCNAL